MAAPGAPSKSSAPGSAARPIAEGGATHLVPESQVGATQSSFGAEDRGSLRAAFHDHGTLESPFLGDPVAPNGSATGGSGYFRAYTADVTEEAHARYRSEEQSELGRGAIGRVFVAYDSHLNRRVAIKELLEQEGDAPDRSRTLQTLSRFLREARVTGGLEHPGIVPVYELGRRADGTLYYTMRVVRGRTLAQAITQSAGLNARLALVNHFSGLCQAIAYAHSRGVVHRDIKPENVMIGEFGETVVLDWGMAKLCGRDSSEAVQEPAEPQLDLSDIGLTLEGSVCGTPLYMSPEQASGRSSEVDQRSDVWSLGVALYVILCGRPPFSGKSLLEIVAQVSAGRYVALREIDADIPAELAAIVERALKPNPSDRYPSARELARDVQAYQAGMRVAAYEYSSIELLRRFVQRQRSAVIASAVGLVVIVLLSVVAYRRLVSARDRAILAERHARENEISAQHSAQAARHSLSEVLIQRAEQALLEGNSVDAELLAARALAEEERADARGVVIAAESALRPTLSATLSESKNCSRTALSFSAGIFACATGHVLRLWSLEKRTLSLELPLDADVTALGFASDGASLAVGLDNATVAVRVATLTPAAWRLESCGGKVSAVAVANSGQALACATARGDTTIWRSEKSEHLQLGQAVSALAFSRDGTKLAVGGELGALLLRDQRSQRRLAGHAGTVLALVFAEQGQFLASGAADRMLKIWDTSTGREAQPAVLHSDAIGALSWSDDRRFMALGGKDKTFRVLDLRTAHSALARQHGEPVELATISADGGQLASYSRDTGLRLWRLASAQRPSELIERGNVLALAPGAGTGQLLSAGLGRNGVCVWDVNSGSCVTRLPVRLDRVRALAVSEDRKKLAVAGSGSQIFVWDLAQNMPIQVIGGLNGETRALSFSRDGSQLAAAGLNRKLCSFDANSGRLLRETTTTAAIQTLSMAAPSGTLVSGDQSGMITFWNGSTGQAAGAFQAHADWVLGSAVSPDWTRLASAGADRLVKVWDAQTRRLLFTLAGHEGKVLSVDFSPDGTLLASGGEDKSVRVWDAHNGRPLATLTGHSGIVRAVRFAGPTLLASGGDDGAIRLWHIEDLTRPGAELARQLTRDFELPAEAL